MPRGLRVTFSSRCQIPQTVKEPACFHLIVFDNLSLSRLVTKHLVSCLRYETYCVVLVFAIAESALV